MSSLIGHGLASTAVYWGLKNRAGLPGKAVGLGLALGFGLAPDVDVIGRMVSPELFTHRGLTHTLAFSLILAGAAALLIRLVGPGRSFFRMWAGLFVVGAVHPLLDYLMGCGPPVMLFWPLTDRGFLSPVQVVPTAYYARSISGLLGLLKHEPTLRGMIIELVIFLPLAGLGFILGRKNKRSIPVWPALVILAAVSIGGVVFTVAAYN